MWECKYGKEPLDIRLCFLRLLRKWWLLLAMTAAGALLFGGFYYLDNVVLAPAKEYRTESEYYIEYKNAVTQEQQYTFYNKETWESLIHTDVFMDEVITQVEGISRDELQSAVFATLLTDVRIVHVTVKTTSPEKTMMITQALESAFTTFGQTQREIDEIRAILISAQAEPMPVDNRIIQACILGAVVFFCFTLFFMYLYVVLDTSVYLPLELERVFGFSARVGILEEKTSESVSYKEQENGSYVVYVKSRAHNRPLVEKTVRELLAEGKTVSEMVLTDADEALIQWYFKTRFL